MMKAVSPISILKHNINIAVWWYLLLFFPIAYLPKFELLSSSYLYNVKMIKNNYNYYTYFFFVAFFIIIIILLLVFIVKLLLFLGAREAVYMTFCHAFLYKKPYLRLWQTLSKAFTTRVAGSAGGKQI